RSPKPCPPPNRPCFAAPTPPLSGFSPCPPCPTTDSPPSFSLPFDALLSTAAPCLRPSDRMVPSRPILRPAREPPLLSQIQHSVGQFRVEPQGQLFATPGGHGVPDFQHARPFQIVNGAR